ncbi:MAG: carbonic anhydrase [Paracoccus sp. (in: a-proteobacteria)]
MSIQKLPDFLAQGFLRWKDNDYASTSETYRKLASGGQNPRVFAIGCCDSRVQTSRIFDANPGDIFIHRNIANLIPKFSAQQEHHGTVAALDYAVDVLQVSHIVVAGHSQCGGVKACHDLETNSTSMKVTPALASWLRILGEEYHRVRNLSEASARVRALEFISITVSLENLLTYPNVAHAVQCNKINLHGVWQNIGDGQLMTFDPVSRQFMFVE